MKRLLAKSDPNQDKPGRGATLPSHASHVLIAAETMLDQGAATALERAGLPGDRAAQWFRSLVLFGAFLHDWGKANDHFQEMVRGKRKEQLVRHEALSALLALQHPPLRAWLAAAPAFQSAEDRWLLEGAVFAAAGHHLKFDARRSDKGNERQGPVSLAGAGDRVKLHLGHEDFTRTLRLGKPLGLSDPPALTDITWTSADPLDDPDNDRIRGPLFEAGRGLLGHGGPGAAWFGALDEERRRLFALAKAWLVAADVAGSALAREHTSLPGWIRSALGAEPSPEQLDEVVAERLDGKPLRPFQAGVAASPARVTLVEAGCGTGKTAAAYAWAAARGRAGQSGKLFFCYPTTGTATEGFLDYVAEPDTIEASLIHGRASLDLELLVTREQKEDDEAQVRNETLQQMEAGIIVCTADTVLGLLQNLRRPLFLSPAISAGRFVFDEIHAYDDRMFAALLDFLRTFPGAPVLLMSASIPLGRRRAIEAITGPLADLPRPADVEGIARYELAPVVEIDGAWAEVRRCLGQGGKVLWVSNTVARAVDAGQQASREGLPVRCYHSRYRYGDRVERHRDVIRAFAPDQPPMLTVTTQVAEMSLDLSADLLITDLASPPALVQRLGRLNRRASPEDPRSPCRALAIKPPFSAPYRPEDITRGNAFWEGARERGRVLSQRDLNAAMHAALGDAPWPPPGDRPADSIWLLGGPVAHPGQLRDAEGSATVLLEQDMPRIERAARSGPQDLHNEILRCAVPIRANRRVWSWPRHPNAPFHPVAPSSEISYDPLWGAAWIKQSHGDLDA